MDPNLKIEANTVPKVDSEPVPVVPPIPPKEADYTIKKPWEEKKDKKNTIIKGTELFIGNLNIETCEDDLYTLFSQHGVITDVSFAFNFLRFAFTKILKLENAMLL